MNINIIRHFLRTNKHLIVEKSLANCHVEGVNSILFDDTPASRIRLFMARKNHTLWKNTNRKNSELSVAFHTHHCDLILETVMGWTINRVVCGSGDYKNPLLTNYVYQSNILTGKSSFIPTGALACFETDSLSSYDDTVINLRSTQIHTVEVEKDKEAAWFVYEGKENPNYSPICYSNADLTLFDDSQLYKRMTLEQIIENLTLIYPSL